MIIDIIDIWYEWQKQCQQSHLEGAERHFDPRRGLGQCLLWFQAEINDEHISSSEIQATLPSTLSEGEKIGTTPAGRADCKAK